MNFEYERDTRQAYRNVEKAQAYQTYHNRGLTWGLVTQWRNRLLIQSALVRCGLSPQAKILDIPCGTGITGDVLQHLPHPVVAADISLEMMAMAGGEYDFPHFLGFVQSDITKTPFRPGDFACIIILGLMHRLSADIRARVLAEVAFLRPRFAIISYSINSRWQHFKQRVIKKLKPSHQPAPVPVPYEEIIREVEVAGMKILRAYQVVPLASATTVLVLKNSIG